MLYLIVFACATVVSLLLTLAVSRFAHVRGWLDQPSPRRIHTKPTPRLGGAAMFLAFALVLTGLVLGGYLNPYTAIGLLVGAGALTLVGFVDDVSPLGPGVKFRFQLAAALVTVVAFDISIRTITLPVIGSFELAGSVVGYGITVFWILGMINTVNFADGVDGLAAGLALVYALLLLIVGLRLRQPELPLYACVLGGSALGFLRYNYAPARIFMGDSGSYFLGFTMGVLSVLGSAKFAAALLVMGVPIADVAYSIIRRFRTGAPVHLPDKGHLHHRLLTLGLSQRTTATIFYALAIGFGSAALIPQRLGRLAALIGLGLISLLIIWFVDRRLRERISGSENAPRL